MTREQVTIPLGAGEVSGELCAPEGHRGGRGAGLILAHGAGNDKNHPLLVRVAEEVARRGFPALRFNFPYRERGKKSPDRPEVLAAAWKAAFSFLQNHRRFGTSSIVMGGKSLGGRMASQLLADKTLPGSALVILGYPLHAPGRKEKLRDGHLYTIEVPMIFFAGTRDSLCDIKILRKVLDRMKGDCILEIIDKGDHSFTLPKSAGVSREKVYEDIAVTTGKWMKGRALHGRGKNRIPAE